jgi:hypothetical protein
MHRWRGSKSSGQAGKTSGPKQMVRTNQHRAMTWYHPLCHRWPCRCPYHRHHHLGCRTHRDRPGCPNHQDRPGCPTPLDRMECLSHPDRTGHPNHQDPSGCLNHLDPPDRPTHRGLLGCPNRQDPSDHQTHPGHQDPSGCLNHLAPLDRLAPRDWMAQKPLYQEPSDRRAPRRCCRPPRWPTPGWQGRR